MYIYTKLDLDRIELSMKNLEENCYKNLVKFVLQEYLGTIMLDKVDSDTIKECIKLNIADKKLELFGDLDYEKVKILADFGIDYLSLGALTHSVKSFDLSLLVE